MKPPCMIVVQHILPALRVLIMKELIEKYNVRKIDVSDKMELTPAAITQYMKGERGASFMHEIAKSEKTMKLLSEIAKELAKEKMPAETIMKKLCEACNTVRAEGVICALHRKEFHALERYKCTICEPSSGSENSR